MIVLLDTSTPVCRLYIKDGDTLHSFEWQADRQLAKGLHQWLVDRLDENGLAWSDITGIGAYEGPGSFTGLRIGLTVLNTMAEALQIPIVAARGDDWVNQAINRLQNREDDGIVLPFYGSDAHITVPRK